MRARASGIAGGLRIGADFFERRGLLAPTRESTDGAAEAAPRGVVDRIADLAHPGIDVAAIDPRVVAFFDSTSELALRIRSRWRFPFSVAWRVALVFLRWIGQFVYPPREGIVHTAAFALDRARDGRPDARAIVRTYDDGTTMQVVAYATWERDGVRLMSAAFPLPGGRVMGLLRMDPLDGGGVVLTSERRNDDAGVWFVLGGLAFPLPLGERLELRPGSGPDCTIAGRHHQYVFGIRYVTHEYRFWPAAPRSNRALPPRT